MSGARPIGRQLDELTRIYAPEIDYSGIYRFRVRAVGENTVTNPTITLPVIGTLTIYKNGGDPLNEQQGGTAGTGDIHGAGHEITLRYRASPQRMELIGVI